MAISQGTYKLSPPTLSDGMQSDLLMNATGGLLVVSGGSGATSDQVQGNVAQGVADAGNPVKVGGYASGPIPTTTAAGNRVNLWLGVNGQTVVGGTTFAGADGSSNTLVQMTISAGASGHQTVAGFLFNGTTWDRQRKPNIFARIASSAASGNPAFLKATAGDLMQIWGLCGATATFLQIYNKASAPTIGTDTPILTYPLLANAAFSQTIPHGGAYCSTGIAYAFTTDAAGTTAAAAAAVTAAALLGA